MQAKNYHYVLWSILGFVAAQWIVISHIHKSDDTLQSDVVCAACMAGQHLNHGAVNTSQHTLPATDHVIALITVRLSGGRFESTYYHSRAPPLFL